MCIRDSYKIAKELGCEYIATGHYAKCFYSEEFKSYVLTKADAEEKDQSYFLYGIDKEILPHVIFPLSDFNNKEEIRKIAEENGLEVAKKKDSQEKQSAPLCYFPGPVTGRYVYQLSDHTRRIGQHPGRRCRESTEIRQRIRRSHQTIR